MSISGSFSHPSFLLGKALSPLMGVSICDSCKLYLTIHKALACTALSLWHWWVLETQKASFCLHLGCWDPDSAQAVMSLCHCRTCCPATFVARGAPRTSRFTFGDLLPSLRITIFPKEDPVFPFGTHGFWESDHAGMWANLAVKNWPMPRVSKQLRWLFFNSGSPWEEVWEYCLLLKCSRAGSLLLKNVSF